MAKSKNVATTKLAFVTSGSDHYFGELDGNTLINAAEFHRSNFNSYRIIEYIKNRNTDKLPTIRLGDNNNYNTIELSPEQQLTFDHYVGLFTLAAAQAPRMLENMSFDQVVQNTKK